MKIAFLGDHTSQNARHWLQGLAARGAQVEIWPASGFASDLLRIYNIRKWLARTNPDIILAYRTTSYGFIGALLADKPLVVAGQGHTDLWPYNLFTLPLKKAFKKYCVQKASFIHAWGANMVPSLLQHGASRDKIWVMPRGVDLKLFAYTEKKQGVSIISTRSLYSEYNHSLTLQVLASLKNKGVPARLILLGDGPMRKPLVAEAHRLGLAGSVKFAGRVPYEEIPVFLQSSTFYLSFPATEGTSASLLEAMACGCYPIVSPLDANRQWIDSGHNGLLSADPQETARHILFVLNNREHLIRAVRANRRQVELRADFDSNMEVFYQKYQELVGQ